MAHHSSYTMAALLSAGGAIGYMKQKSLPSLIGGITLGAGFGAAGYMLQKGKMTNGHATSLLFSTITMSSMGLRAFQTRKSLPTALSVIGAVSSAYHAQAFMKWIGQE